MKELSIEEKAKAYDKAIEVAKRKLCFDNAGMIDNFTPDDIREIFPELSESEDERIMKRLICGMNALKEQKKETFATIPIDDAIAWLEKQGESDEIKAKKFLINKGYPIDTNGTFPTYEEMYNIISEGLEKQVEKPQDKTALETIMEEKSPVESLGISPEKYEEIINECIYGEQKSVDKAEPKFHEDEWVVDNNGKVAIIYDLQKAGYVGHYTNGTDFVCKYGNEHLLHLWTIQDAKEGDMLVDVYENIGIYQQHDDFDWTSYCSLGFHGGFQNFKVEHENDKTHPATKEQRDILMKAMTDAGWEFDFKEKVLKKIEQNPVWSEEDEYLLHETVQHLEELIRIDKAKHCACDVQYYQRDIDWLKSLKQRMEEYDE